jgi:hypothetical protein
MTSGERRDGVSEGDSRLAARYERLLRWYPAGHQARHGGEMLGVLLAAAGPGQERPGRGESANLIGGALRIRLRAATTGSAGQWRDALARAAILLPLAAVVLQVITLIVVLTAAPGMVDQASIVTVTVEVRLPMLVLLIIVLAGWRRIALAAAVVLAALVIGNLIVFAGPALYLDPGEASELTIALIVALAMVLRAGSPPGRTLLTWRHYTLTAVLVVALIVTDGLEPWPPTAGPVPYRTLAALAGAAVIAVIAGRMLFASPASRRLLAIVALPLYFYLLAPYTDPGLFFPYQVLLVGVPFAAVLLAAIVIMALAVARHRRSRQPSDGDAA